MNVYYGIVEISKKDEQGNRLFPKPDYIVTHCGKDRNDVVRDLTSVVVNRTMFHVMSFQLPNYFFQLNELYKKDSVELNIGDIVVDILINKSAIDGD